MTTRDTMYSDDATAAHIRRRQTLSVLDAGVFKMPPETDGSGNIEYKVKLNTISSTRRTHLATQLQWRLAEGNGHAIYVVGVHDNGEVVGITEDELQTTVDIMQNMAKQLGNVHLASIDRRRLSGKDSRVVAEVHFVQRSLDKRTELRVAVLGDYGVGKSTVLGCLTYDEADDGRGKSRLNLLRHRHEVESGRTSSITLETVGFDADGKVLNYANNRSAEQIYQRSQHVVTFVDTCGYAKHLKTTASAITGHSPHVYVVAAAADSPTVTDTTREYLRIASVLRAPLAIVVTKMDTAVKRTFAAMMKDLLYVLSTTIPERSQCMVTSNINSRSLAQDMMDLSVVPIFTTSAVRNMGLDSLTAVLALARQQAPSLLDVGEDGFSNPFEFHIEHLFTIDTVGLVATGWVKSGLTKAGLDTGRRLMVGPNAAGEFADVAVTSIHTLRIPTETAEAESSAALAIQISDPSVTIRKGMVIIDAEYLDDNECSGRISDEFVVRAAILNSAFKSMQSIIVHIRSTYRLAHIIEVTTISNAKDKDCDILVRLKFDEGVCDYMYPNMPVVARDGQSFAFVGHIDQTL